MLRPLGVLGLAVAGVYTVAKMFEVDESGVDEVANEPKQTHERDPGQELFEQYFQLVESWIMSKASSKDSINLKLVEMEKQFELRYPNDYRHEVSLTVLRRKSENTGLMPNWREIDLIKPLIQGLLERDVYVQLIFKQYYKDAEDWLSYMEYGESNESVLQSTAHRVLNERLEKVEKPMLIANPKDFRAQIVRQCLKHECDNEQFPHWKDSTTFHKFDKV